MTLALTDHMAFSGTRIAGVLTDAQAAEVAGPTSCLQVHDVQGLVIVPGGRLLCIPSDWQTCIAQFHLFVHHLYLLHDGVVAECNTGRRQHLSRGQTFQGADLARSRGKRTMSFFWVFRYH